VTRRGLVGELEKLKGNRVLCFPVLKEEGAYTTKGQGGGVTKRGNRGRWIVRISGGNQQYVESSLRKTGGPGYLWRRLELSEGNRSNLAACGKKLFHVLGILNLPSERGKK